jgi:hypothetical protein
MTPHPHPYTVGWLRQGRDLRVNQQCYLPYDINPFKDEVLCDITPLEVCDVLTHYQVKHLINLTPGTPLPNGPIYWHSLMENDEIKRQIQELLQKGHIRPNSSPCRSSIVLVRKKDETW